jgi:hypothetical protein
MLSFITIEKFSRNAHYNRSYDHNAFNSHAMNASSSTFVHDRNRPRKNHVLHHVPRKMCNESATIFHACNTTFVLSCKNKKWLLGSWGPNARKTRLVFGSQRLL